MNFTQTNNNEGNVTNCNMSSIQLLTACRKAYRLLEDMINIKAAICYSNNLTHLNKADLALLFSKINEAEELINKSKNV